MSSVSGLLYATRCNILEAQQYSDPETGLFFKRVVFARIGDAPHRDQPAGELEKLAGRLAMTYTLRPLSLPKRVMLLVSKFDHCLSRPAQSLADWQVFRGVVAVVSNHGKGQLASTDLKDLPPLCLPVSRDGKEEQEAKLMALIERTNPDPRASHADLVRWLRG